VSQLYTNLVVCMYKRGRGEKSATLSQMCIRGQEKGRRWPAILNERTRTDEECVLPASPLRPEAPEGIIAGDRCTDTLLNRHIDDARAPAQHTCYWLHKLLHKLLQSNMAWL
jgi:hypothetical protein